MLTPNIITEIIENHFQFSGFANSCNKLETMFQIVLGKPCSAGFRGGRAPHQKGTPTMFMRLDICTTYAWQLVVFISEESLFVDAIIYRSARRQYFTCRLFGIVTKQLLHLLVSWKSVMYLNLVNARTSHVEPVLPLLFFLLDLGFFCFLWGSGFFIENLGFFDSGQILEMYVVLLYFPFNNTVISQA